VRRLVRWSLAALGIAGVAALILSLDTYGGVLGCGRVPACVRGVVRDATGAPVEGAFLLTLRDPETASDPEALGEWRAKLRWREGYSRDELVRFPGRVGSARTNNAGAFEVIISLGTSQWRGRLGITRRDFRESASDVVRALLVERDGYAPLVHETEDARWVEQPEGPIAGTLDVGTIRLAAR
jgi:hypothetical protein